MSKIFGVDLSEYQKGISFPRLKEAGVEFAILRGGDGSYRDVCFADFYTQAKQNGLAVGAYWFSRALNAEQAKAEAQRFYDSCLKGRKFELPVYIDCEANAQMNLGKRALTDVIKAWAAVLKGYGLTVGVYTTANWFRNYMILSELDGLERWVAQWSSSSPTLECGMWQFGGETNYLRSSRLVGYTVDQNYMLTDYRKGEIDMTKEEVTKLIDERIEKALGGEGTEVSEWAKEELAEAVKAGITDGSRPRGYATREETAAMVLRSTK